MGHARIDLLPTEEATRIAREIGMREDVAALSIFRVLLRQPRVAKAVSDLLFALLTESTLDARLRELIIMRLGWATGSVYEWTQHWRVARALKIPERDLLGVRDWRAHDHWSAADRAILAATDESLEHGAVSEATWKECCAALPDPREQIELVVAIGNWRMISQILRSLEIPLEEGVEAWPPDGKAP